MSWLLMAAQHKGKWVGRVTGLMFWAGVLYAVSRMWGVA